MNRNGRIVAWLAIGMGGALVAQVPEVPEVPWPSSGPEDAVVAPVPPSAAAPVRSPVDFFRELLAASPEERKLLLTNRPPEIERRILAKVREYESLKPNERALRLRVTELRWYLSPMMSSPPTDRAAQLAQVPEKDRPLIAERIQEWDKLTPALQQELLDNEAAIRYFYYGRDPALRPLQQPEIVSPARFRKLQAGIRQWQSLTEPQRERITNRFNQFFELTEGEKDKTLSTLSEPERRQIEKTLRSFGQLSAAQRSQCIKSFQRFASMSLEERQQFLKNADRWKSMKPDERQAWRDLIEKLPPEVHVPPVPPALARLRRPSLVATNQASGIGYGSPTR